MSNTITIGTDDLRLTQWDIDEPTAVDRDAVISPLHTLFFGITPSGDELLLRVAGRRAGRVSATLTLLSNSAHIVRLRQSDGQVLDQEAASSLLQFLAWRAFSHTRTRLLSISQKSQPR